MSKEIPLQNGMYAIVDDEDYERCMDYNWYQGRNVVYTKMNKNGLIQNVALSEFVYKKRDETNIILHKNLNTLDLRKGNLVEVNPKNKFYISGPSKNNTSGYKGVSWSNEMNKWHSYITVNGYRINLGFFDNKDAAAKVYNESVKKYFGEYAFINIIGVDNRRHRESKPIKQHRREVKKYTSKYRGVSLNKNTGRCRVSISYKGKQVHVGSFYNEKQAAKAYDKKAYELYGDKAILNFPGLKGEYSKC